MKKIYYFYSLLLTALFLLPWSGVKAEQLNESFENTTFAPDGWTTNHSGGTSYAWERTSSGSGGYGTYCAYVRYGSSGKTTENYLITPQLHPQSGEKLVFYTKQQYNGNTTFSIEVSTTTAATSAFTTTLFTYTDAGATTSTWAKQEVDLASYVDQDIYIAFHVVDVYGFSIYIDDVSGVTLKPESCPKPGTPAASDVTSTTATISWTQGGTEDTWNLRYKKSTTSVWTEVNGLTSASYDLTGLTAGKTTYNYEVQADCGGGDNSDWKAGTAFQTECGNITIPTNGWEYNFDSDAVNTIPSCWKRITSNSYYPCVDNTYKHSGSNCVIFVGYNYDGAQYVVLPEMATDIENLKLSFWYMSNSSTYTKEMSVGYITNAETATYTTAVYTPIQTLTDNTDWSNITNVLFTDAPSGARIAFYMKGTKSSSSYKGRMYIDDIKVESNIDCSKPATPVASDITGTSAHVAWTANAGVTSYKYIYQTSGSAAPDETAWDAAAITSETFVDLIGLTDGQAYDFYVMCACGTEASDPCTFISSSCPTVTDAWLSEQTYSSVKVSCELSIANKKWELQKKVDDGAWESVATEIADAYKEVAVEVGHSYAFQVKPSCGSDWTAAGSYTPAYGVPGTPSVTSITASSASATWTAALYGATGYEYVLMPGDAAADWTSPTDATSPLALTGLTDGTNYTLYVRAKFGENSGDAVSANFTTATVAPAFTSADPATTTTTATIALEAYTGSATQFQYVVMAGSAAANWASATIAATTTSIALDELTAGSSYTLYVRAYYSATLQSTAASKPFQTNCDTKAIGWSETFNDGVVPTCWTISNKTSYGWATYNYTDETGSYCMRYNGRGSTGYYELLETPSISITEKAMLKFNIKTSTTSPEFKVLISKDGGTTKAEKGSYSATTSKSGKEIDLSEFVGETIIVYFQGKSANSSSRYVYLDDVRVEYKPIDAPTDLTAEAGDASATISWTDDVEAGPWDIQYRAYKAEEPYESWSTPISSASKSYNLTGLTNGTEYEVQVRTHCSENRISAWTASQTFTPVACPAVTAVNFGDATYNSVVVNWAAEANSTWELQYKAGEGDWSTASNAVNALTYTLEGLTTGTACSVRVKATCADELAWVEAATTFTPAYTAPANAAVADATDAAASASWEAVADAEGYKYAVVVKDAAVNWDEATTTNDLSAVLTGLAGLTNYDFYVAAVYGDHVEAAAPVNFQTVAVAPTDLTQGATTTNSIAFSWSYAGAASQFQWKSSKEGSVWSDPISALTATETGLAGGTSYTIYVRAYYADGKYSSELSETFGTECAVMNLPFSQDFEAGISPICWTAATSTADYYDYDGNYGWKVTADNDGNYVMRFKSGTSMTMPALTLPQIDLTATPAVLSFKVRNVYSNKTVAGNVTVSAEGVEDLVTALTTSSSLTEQRIDLTAFAGKRITIKFQATSNAASGRIDLDDIRIAEHLNLLDGVDNSATLSANLNKTIDVTIGRTFVCADYYNTICLPFDLSAEELAASPIATTDLWAFKYARVEGGELLIRIIEADHINAGEPYLIAWPAGEPIVNPLFKDVTISASAGKMMGEEALKFVGILKPETFAAHDDTKLFLYENNALYWWNGDAESHLYSFRAFFSVEGGAGSSPIMNIPARIIKHDQTATGIGEVQGNENMSFKVLENNQVIIIRNGVKYTIQGQKIQ